MGQIRDKQEFEETWNRLIEQEERRMSGTWLEQALVPLSRTCMDFEVKKKFTEKNVLNTLNNATGVSTISTQPQHNRSGDYPRNGHFEKWIESDDKTIGGCIDAIIPTPEGDILIDYKTGKILDGDDRKECIKDEYLFQLKLYAALYHQYHHRWPRKIEIRGFGDVMFELDMNPDDCAKAFADASSLFRNVNALITESIREGNKNVAGFSSPSPKNCRYCQYRPLCDAYWNARQRSCEEAWPFDIKGKIIEKTLLKNGNTLLKIYPSECEAEPKFIKGVQHDRHPNIGSVGDTVMICSLRPEKQSKNFQEGVLTTYYVIKKFER